MKRAKGTYDKKSPRIDFSTWNMHTSDHVEAVIEKLFTKVLKEAFEIARDYECYANFRIDHWDGKGRMPDPDVIQVSLPIGAQEYEEPTWTFSLREIVFNMIDVNESGTDGPIVDEGTRKALAATSKHLRQLADTLDAALERKP